MLRHAMGSDRPGAAIGHAILDFHQPPGEPGGTRPSPMGGERHSRLKPSESKSGKESPRGLTSPATAHVGWSSAPTAGTGAPPPPPPPPRPSRAGDAPPWAPRPAPREVDSAAPMAGGNGVAGRRATAAVDWTATTLRAGRHRQGGWEPRGESDRTRRPGDLHGVPTACRTSARRQTAGPGPSAVQSTALAMPANDRHARGPAHPR